LRSPPSATKHRSQSAAEPCRKPRCLENNSLPARNEQPFHLAVCKRVVKHQRLVCEPEHDWEIPQTPSIATTNVNRRYVVSAAAPPFLNTLDCQLSRDQADVDQAQVLSIGLRLPGDSKMQVTR